MFEQRENSREWARQRHFTRTCSRCHRDKDVHLFDFELTYLCTNCAIIFKQEKAAALKNKREQENQSEPSLEHKKEKGLFDNIIWPK